MSESLRDLIPKPDLYRKKLEGFQYLSDKQAGTVMDNAIKRQQPVSEKFHQKTRDDEAFAHDVAQAIKPEIDAAYELGVQIKEAKKYGAPSTLSALELKKKAVAADIEHNYGLAASAGIVYIGHSAVEREVQLTKELHEAKIKQDRSSTSLARRGEYY